MDKEQKALAVFTIPLPNEDPGLMTMCAIANMGVKAEDLEKAMDAEIAKLTAAPISDNDYKKLMNQAENDFITQNSRVAGIAENLATNYTYFHNAALVNTELERYTKVTKEDLLRVAKKYLVKENRLVVYYLPKADEKK